MGLLTGGFDYIVPFLIVLTVLVFVHELGHYLVARWNGVRIEVFSIGFGPELFGWNDRAGTRWKFSVDAAGRLRQDVRRCRSRFDAGRASCAAMTPEERAVSFHHKRLPQRAAVVAAGPIANFVFAIVVLAGSVRDRGPALHAAAGRPGPAGQRGRAGGVKAGDVIVGHRRRADRALRGRAAHRAPQSRACR